MSSRAAVARSFDDDAPHDGHSALDARPEGHRVSLHQAVAQFIGVDCILLVSLAFLPLQARSLVSGRASAFPNVADAATIGALAVVLFLASQKILGGYRLGRVLTRSHTIPRLVLALFITFSLLMTFGAAAKITGDFSRLWFFSWMLMSFTALPAMRLFSLSRLRRVLDHGDFVYRALSVGALCEPPPAATIAQLSKGLSKALPPARLKGLDEIARLANDVRDHNIDEVYISVPWALAPELFRRLESLQHLSANIFVLPSVAHGPLEFVHAKTNGTDLQIQVIDRPIEGWNFWLKRWCDVVVAAAALLLLSPVMAIVALAIVVESRGPILFRQPRRGFNGHIFELLKFRSMYTESTDAGADRQTSKRDDRVTCVGRVIRRTSLDELPQLFNVLQGHMSIVGPRPHALKTSAEGKLLADAVNDYAARYRVRPGMTGWAQVNGYRGELDSIHKLRQRVRYDMEYIQNWSIAFDIRIIMKTIRLLFHDPHAY